MWIKNHTRQVTFSPIIHALFWLLSGNKVKFPISEGNLNFLLCSENFWRNLCWRHCKYKEWVSFFLGSWEMNRSAEQTNRVNRGSRDLFVPHCDSFPMNREKKDTHSLNILGYRQRNSDMTCYVSGKFHRWAWWTYNIVLVPRPIPAAHRSRLISGLTSRHR